MNTGYTQLTHPNQRHGAARLPASASAWRGADTEYSRWSGGTAAQQAERIAAAEALASTEDILDLTPEAAEVAEALAESKSALDARREEADAFKEQLRQSNEQIKAATQLFQSMMIELKPVPSTIGYPLKSVAGVLKSAELSMGPVTQEYSDNIPAGHVVSTIPAPGGRLAKNACVRIVISKGPPPEKEKHITMRQRERVAVLRVKLHNADPDQMTQMVNSQALVRAMVAASVSSE